MTGRRPPELDNPVEFPDKLAHVWYWFLRLNSKRTSNGFGLNPISNAELWFFFQLEDVEPESWEIQLIEKLDQVALENFSKQQDKKNKQESKPKK